MGKQRLERLLVRITNSDSAWPSTKKPCSSLHHLMSRNTKRASLYWEIQYNPEPSKAPMSSLPKTRLMAMNINLSLQIKILWVTDVELMRKQILSNAKLGYYGMNIFIKKRIWEPHTLSKQSIFWIPGLLLHKLSTRTWRKLRSLQELGSHAYIEKIRSFSKA